MEVWATVQVAQRDWRAPSAFPLSQAHSPELIILTALATRLSALAAVTFHSVAVPGAVRMTALSALSCPNPLFSDFRPRWS